MLQSGGRWAPADCSAPDVPVRGVRTPSSVVLFRSLRVALPRMFQSWALHGLDCSWLLVHGLVQVTSSLPPLGLLLSAASLLVLGLFLLAAPPLHHVLVLRSCPWRLASFPGLIHSWGLWPLLQCSSPDDPIRGFFLLLSLDTPVRGAAAPASCSAPDDPVLGVFCHLSLDVPVRGAAASAAWSAPDVPLRGVRSLGRSLAWSPRRCCSSASSGPPPLCFSSVSWGFLGGVSAFWWALPAWLGVARHRLRCRGCVVVARTVRVCGSRRPLLLGT